MITRCATSLFFFAIAFTPVPQWYGPAGTIATRVGSARLFAQDPPFAQETPPAEPLEVGIKSVGVPQGVRAFTPGRWGYLKVEVENKTSQEQRVRATAYVKDSPELRYSHDLWLPPQSLRTSWIPIFMPELREGEELAQREIIGRIEYSDGRRSEESSYLAPLAKPNTTIFIDGWFDEALDPSAKEYPYEAALALRETRNLNRQLMRLTERFTPAALEGWDAVGHVILAGSRMNVDVGGLSALRHWIEAGGHLWIQLNETPLETMQALLGSAVQIEVIDTIPVNEFQFRATDAGPEAIPITASWEEPVELMRASIDGGQVLHTIDGWPASVQIPLGKGMVLVTLLEARGWIRQRDNSDVQFSDNNPMHYTDFVALDPLRDLANRFYDPGASLEVPDATAAQYVVDRIGYQIPSRGYVLAVLGTFTVLIGVFGAILAVRKQLEHLAWITGLWGLIATLVIVSAGFASRAEVPPTASHLNLLRVVPETGEYVGGGTIALYQGEQSIADLATTSGLRIEPLVRELTGKIRQQVWEDTGQWKWGETTLPPGVKMIRTRSAGSTGSPVTTHARLDKEGIVGQIEVGSRLSGKEQKLEDGILLFPYAPPLSVRLQAGGHFVASSADCLAEGQLSQDALINDEQRRRQKILANLLDQWRERPLAEPLLLCWSDGGDADLLLDPSIQRTGSTLLMVPLVLEKTPPQTAVEIPGSLLPAIAVFSQSGQSSAFDNKRRAWNYPNAIATSTRLRFQLPAEVLPLQIERATLTIQCTIPSRVLQVFAIDGEERTEVFSRSSPSGQITVDLNADSGLAVDATGGIFVEIVVGEGTALDFSSAENAPERQQTMANSGWTIRSTRLDVFGTTSSP